MKKKNTEMIVFDMFVDIESKQEIQIYFFQIFKISYVKRVLVKVETPVECVKSDG